jgi:hypothetical protein
MGTIVAIAGLKPGADERVRHVLRAGPPFDLEGTPFERHMVFVDRNQLVALVEGQSSQREVAGVLAEALRDLIAGPVRTLEEVFSWTRPISFEGVTFGPYPGPGDSDGGTPPG